MTTPVRERERVDRTVLAAPSRTSRRITAIVFLVAFVGAALTLTQLTRQQLGGPAHVNIQTPAGVPATLYLPVRADMHRFMPDPPPADARYPAIVLGHGYAADRVLMSSLARSFAAHGYAVVAFDFRGHGDNARSFGGSNDGAYGSLSDDLRSVVDWASRSAYIDPSRIAVMGHSMGAGAVTGFSAVDARPVAVVALSGGAPFDGPERPRNILYLAAKGDPAEVFDEVHQSERELAAAGVPYKEEIIPGVDHITELWSGRTVRDTTAFLDPILHPHVRAAARIHDARLGTMGLYLVCALVLLAGAGVVVGRIAAVPAVPTATGVWFGLAIVLGALVLASPFLAGGPAALLPLSAGSLMFSLVAVAGTGVLVARAIAPAASRWGIALAHDRPVWLGGRRTAAAAGLGIAAVYVLLSPFGTVFHRIVPTPPRLVATIVGAALMFPFTLAFETVVRRGSVLGSSLAAIAGRVGFIVVLSVLVRVGLAPPVVSLILPVQAVVFVLLEVFAIAAYRRGRNVAPIAIVEAFWLAWLLAVAMPLG